ncbi:MAG: PKD domain-containing protein [Ketobacteraceae bacterium]|nr:PKD domain-containing protein [Ketobacteraceae bacterium]
MKTRNVNQHGSIGQICVYFLMALAFISLEGCHGAENETDQSNNTLPRAHIAADSNPQTIRAAMPLDGRGSSDADGDLLTYFWEIRSQPAGSNGIMDNAKQAIATLVPDLPGAYEVALVVSDGKQNSDPALSSLILTNTTPVADAGNDQSVNYLANVTLDGSQSSDNDGHALNFNWEVDALPEGSVVTLSDPTIANPTFTVDQSGDYQFVLVVNDGFADSSADTVTVSTLNIPPVANAGADISNRQVGDEVILDGSGSSDLDGDSLNFEWSFEGMPEESTATLDDPNAPMPRFTVDAKGQYTLALTVNDGQLDSEPASVLVNAINTPPVAHALEDKTVEVGDLASLTARLSSDADGDPLTFSWSFTSRPSDSNAILQNSNHVNTQFTPDVEGIYILQVLVDDGETSDSATVTVTANVLGSQTPTAKAGPDQQIVLNGTVFLDGSGSTDPQNDSLNYSWSFTSIPTESNALLQGASTVMPSFVVDAVGDYVVQLIVDDGVHKSDPDTVTIGTNLRPVAEAGDDQNMLTGQTIELDGRDSSDPNPEDSLSYQWSTISQPEGAIVSLSNKNDLTTDFTADMAGIYIIQLIVGDGSLSSEPDTVTVTVVEPNVLIYTDRASFEAALGTFSREGFNESLIAAPSLEFDDLTVKNFQDVDLKTLTSDTLVSEGTRALTSQKSSANTAQTEHFSFNAPTTAFGIDINAFNTGQLQVYTPTGLFNEFVWDVTEDGEPPGTLFFGVISDLSFSTVLIGRSSQSDGVGYDNLVYNLQIEP